MTAMQTSARKGLTRWFPRAVHPVREGDYECIVRISRAVPPMRWTLMWDRKGFRAPCPMVVLRWRGQTRRSALANARAPLPFNPHANGCPDSPGICECLSRNRNGARTTS